MHLRPLFLLPACLAALPQISAVTPPATQAQASAVSSLQVTQAAASQGDAAAQFLLGRRYCVGAGIPVNYAEAAKWFMKAAKQGNADAQCELGFLYQTGIGVSKNSGTSRKWYQQAAEQGHDRAFYELGKMYLEGAGGKRDVAKAYAHFLLAQVCGDWLSEYFVYEGEQAMGSDRLASGRELALKMLLHIHSIRASLPQTQPLDPPLDEIALPSNARNAVHEAEKGCSEGQYQLGCMYGRGDGLPNDAKKAFEWFLKAAEQGHAKAQHEVGRAYEVGHGVKWNYAEAVKWHRKAAEQGQVDAQIDLGHHLAEGHEGPDSTVPQNATEATMWFQKAEAQADAKTLCWLGKMYTDAPGDAKDLVAAARCYRKATEQGSEEGLLKLGRAYEIGAGVPKDSAEAAKWYLKAAASGNADAQYNLGMMYADGDGVPQEAKESQKWFKAAAAPRKTDTPDEPNRSDQMLRRTDRVSKSKLKAYAFFLVAMKCGHPEAKVCLEELGNTLTPNEIAEARAKAELVGKKFSTF